MLLPPVAFGPFRLDPENATLFRDGKPVAIGQRGALLLGALLARPGEILTKAALMDAAWPGMAIEESNLPVQIASLRKLLGRAPGGGEWIATISRVGYRFNIEPEVASTAMLVQPLASVIPAIAVLPFKNKSADPEQDYFSDGLTEDIITALSRLRRFFVIARNSSFTYKGKATDVRDVSRDLGVRYVLEGSVRRVGNRLRVTSHLVDAISGAQVWADRYDRALADIFAVQDEITASVVATIEPQLYEAEKVRLQRKPPESLDAWGYVMRAMPLAWTNGTEKENEIAVRLLRRAIEIDPNYAHANSLLSWALAARAALGWEDPAETLATALSVAQRAIEQDRQDPWGHLTAGYVHMLARRFKMAVSELRESIEYNPSFTMAHMILGLAHGYGGLPDEGLAEVAIAARLSPRDPIASPAILSSTGLCHLIAGRFGEAIEFEQRAVQAAPSFGTAWRTLAAAAGMAGDPETATSALAQAKRLQPGLTLEWVEMHHPIVHAEDRAKYVEGLRKAGLQ